MKNLRVGIGQGKTTLRGGGVCHLSWCWYWGMKSLQNVVNEAMTWLNEPLVTASAYSQARYKLKHTAFIELNQEAVVNTHKQSIEPCRSMPSNTKP